MSGRVTGSPATIWLVYGDLDDDATHADCYQFGDVTWCQDAQFDSDVCYVRADISLRRVQAALDDRAFVHAESSRIYARLAGAVRAGADDAMLAAILRAEVEARNECR